MRSQTFCAPELASCAFIDGNRRRLTNEIKPGMLSRISKNRSWMCIGGSLTGGLNINKQAAAAGSLFCRFQRLGVNNQYPDSDQEDLIYVFIAQEPAFYP